MTSDNKTLKMADPKYADLPGIAYDQQDVYETSDLPESEQTNQEIQEENDGIERVSLNSAEAYGKFKEKSLDSSNADFSDRIGHRRCRGFDVGEFEIAAESAVETPHQKYHRLQHEMGLLVEQVGSLKESADKKEVNERISAVELVKEAETLHAELQKLKLEEVLGVEISNELSDPSGTLHKKLMADLEIFKHGISTESKPTTKATGSSSDDNHVVYELHYRPELAKFNQTSVLTELDQRLQKLESIMGSDIDKVVSLAGDTNYRSVLGAISVMNSKLNLLDAAHLDHIDAHLAALSLRLTQIAEKKAVVEDAEKLSKISELYDMVKKNEVVYAELPAIVDRFTVLKDLHEQALQFSTALTQLDFAQQQISASLQNNEDVLATVQKEMNKNMDIIKANATSLHDRITALQKLQHN